MNKKELLKIELELNKKCFKNNNVKYKKLIKFTYILKYIKIFFSLYMRQEGVLNKRCKGKILINGEHNFFCKLK